MIFSNLSIISLDTVSYTHLDVYKRQVVFSATKNMPKVTTTLVACGSSSKQDVVTGVQSDTETKTAYFAGKTWAGSLKIVKTSDDGKVDGVKFKIDVYKRQGRNNTALAVNAVTVYIIFFTVAVNNVQHNIAPESRCV